MSGEDPNFNPEDLALFEHLRVGNTWLRSVLATLARRGVAFRRDHPQRAQAWLEALATFPYYKAGQFLFDLLEWEDFILDEPVAPIATTLDSEALRRLSEALRSVQAHLDGAILPEPIVSAPVTFSLADDTNLPPLEGGFYLYQDIVLGVMQSVLPGFSANPQQTDLP